MFDGGVTQYTLNKKDYKLITTKESGAFNKDNIHPEDQLVVPYLPDPLCLGAIILGLPKLSTPTIGFYPQINMNVLDEVVDNDNPINDNLKGIWPNAIPFRIRVAGNDEIVNVSNNLSTNPSSLSPSSTALNNTAQQSVQPKDISELYLNYIKTTWNLDERVLLYIYLKQRLQK
jgi:hypothetical protein